MRVIRVLFYKAGKDGKWLDNAIAFWTGLWNRGTPPYSHCEIEFVNRGVCFSSATRGDFTGVRFELSSVVLKHRGRWDYIEKTISDEEEERLFGEASRLIGTGYDYWGVFGFLFPIHFEDKKKYYCSEVVAHILYKTGILKKRYAPVSPRRLSGVLGALWGLLPKRLTN